MDFPGLGRLYRQISQESLRFSMKPLTDIGKLWPAYIQLKTGIGPFNKYLHLIGRSNSPYCECGAVDTATHYILHCSQYKNERRRLKRSGGTWELNNLFCTKTGRKDLLAFVEATRRLVGSDEANGG